MSGVDGDSCVATQEEVTRLRNFTRFASHDLRAPLTIIEAAAARAQQMLSAGDVVSAEKMLELMNARAQQASALLADLMRMAELDAPLYAKPSVDLTAIANDAYATLLQTGTPNSEFELSNLGFATATPSLLRQVFVNLLGNAAKFSRSSRPSRIQVGTTRWNGGTAIFVRDNGVGMPSTDAEHAFEPFRRLHGSKFPGHGIGLAFVREALTRQGGKVWVKSAPGEGATFYFTLPDLTGPAALQGNTETF